MSQNEPRYQGVEKAELVALIATALAPMVQQNADANRVMLDAMNEVKMGQQLTNERMARIALLADAHEGILRGNGRSGLIARIDSLEDDVKDNSEDIRDVLSALRGEEDHPGLIGRVSQLEIKAEGLAKPLWIILSALLGTGVTLLVTNLVK